MKLFEDIANYGKNFVQGQRGIWDHKKWEQFLTDIQKKGVTVTEETAYCIGEMLESLKRIFTSISMNMHIFDKIADSAKEFVMNHKGKWNHDLWSGFLISLQNEGIPEIEKISEPIGSVLESLKRLYFLLPQIHTSFESQEMKSKETVSKNQGAQLIKKQESPVVIKSETPVIEKPLTPLATMTAGIALKEKYGEGQINYLKPFPRLKKKCRKKSRKTAFLKVKKVYRKPFKTSIRQNIRLLRLSSQ